MASQLKAYMDYNDLHDPLQSAYKTAHSTESALLKVQNDILRTVDHGGVVVLVLLDLSAAFDTIDHSILLDRMRHQLGINLFISDPANPDTTQQECTRLESCLTDILLWMSANKLKLNTDKTEVLVVGTECKLSAYFRLRSIGLARKMLTVAAMKQLVQALVISRLDYCNSLLTGIPTSLMSRLEMVEHRAAHLIFRS